MFERRGAPRPRDAVSGVVSRLSLFPLRILCVASAIICVAIPSVHAQVLPYAAKGQNLGVVTCANSLCHGSVASWKDSNILQNEYVTWSRVDKHATRAYHVLLEERSQRIARNLGIKEPAQQAKL